MQGMNLNDVLKGRKKGKGKKGKRKKKESKATGDGAIVKRLLHGREKNIFEIIYNYHLSLYKWFGPSYLIQLELGKFKEEQKDKLKPVLKIE